MKKLIVILFLCLMLAGSVFAAGTGLNFSQDTKDKVNFVSTTSSHFRITALRQDPYPANPGTYTDLYIRVENSGGNVPEPKFSLILPSVLSIDKASSSSQDGYPAIQGGDLLTLHYKLNVNKDAVPGEYQIEFRAYDNPNLYSSYFFNVKIDDVTANFDVAFQDVTKDGIAIAVSNTGKNTASAITIKLGNQEDFELLGTSDSIIGNLNAGDYTIISTFVRPKDPNKENLNLKLQIDYTDVVGNRRTLNKNIPVSMTYQVKKGFTDLVNAVIVDPNLKKSSGSKFFVYTILILIIAILAIIFYYRRKNKDK